MIEAIPDLKGHREPRVRKGRRANPDRREMPEIRARLAHRVSRVQQANAESQDRKVFPDHTGRREYRVNPG